VFHLRDFEVRHFF